MTFDDFLEKCGCSRRAAEVLWKRGIKTPEEARALLYPLEYKAVPPKDIPYIDTAVDVIKNSLEKGDPACIFGDYDVDGVTAAAVLVEAFRHVGFDASYYLPDRFSEGYGISSRAVEKLADRGIKLIVTCDNGITANEAVERARECGLTIVVTDHHLPGNKIPPADALLNPKFLPDGHPARMLSGAAVAYLLAKELTAAYDTPLPEGAFLDIVSLSIIADAVPLLDDNRYWLVKGLPYLWLTSRPGLQSLFKLAGIDTENAAEGDLAFQVTPRLNAAGRVSHANLALELLLCRQKDKAEELALELDRQNQQRKDITAGIIQEAAARVDKNCRAVVLYDPLWHEGIMGIAAGKLAEMFDKPAFLMTKKQSGIVAGSARSAGGIDVYRALEMCSCCLAGFGGHVEAAGFQLEEENIADLKKALDEAAGDMSGEEAASYQVDLCLDASEINMPLYRELRELAPFGESNPSPLCFTKDLSILSQRLIGNEQHTRLVLGKENITLPALWWFNSCKINKELKNVIYTLDINKYNNYESIYLNIVDVNYSDNQVVAEKNLEVADRRESDITTEHLDCLAGEFPEALIYGEGANFKKMCSQDILSRVIDRYTACRARQLILAVSPPSALVLEEMLALVNPELLVLGFAPGANSLQSFITLMQGMLKYTFNNLNGRTTVKVLAAASGELEELVSAALKFISAKTGMQIYFTENTVYLLNSDVPVKEGRKEVNQLEEELRFLINSSNSFRRYLYNCSCSEFSNTFILSSC
ncbi:MAG: single-stranded-DNA-specific exonuclease RecJ [Clostridiales bacterium]|nr:single-stranded-DNA-specific exonuclease RecJ [Clostridiales bacterium]MCF8022208.1 single-stranded-DNA-specific exonuclease RecJ [Clostridiales bacterium]